MWRGADSLLNCYFASITLESLFERGQAHPSIEAALNCKELFASSVSREEPSVAAERVAG